jgi:hypothetical protein
MKQFLPPPVTPSEVRNRSARAAGILSDKSNANKFRNDRTNENNFATAHDAVGSEEPIGMGGW